MRVLLRGMGFIAIATMLGSCGLHPSDKKDSSAPPPPGGGDQVRGGVSYSEVNTILTNYCGKCHSDGADPDDVFVGHQDTIDKLAPDISARIQSTDPKEAMPPIRKARALTDQQKHTMLVFLGKAQPNPGEPKATFDADIAPILNDQCVPCHAQNNSKNLPAYVGNQTLVTTDADKIADLITTTDQSKVMPPPSKPLPRPTSDEIQKILAYLGAK